jgi:hypothetical protein
MVSIENQFEIKLKFKCSNSPQNCTKKECINEYGVCEKLIVEREII